jgi:Histidine kinase-, DNA gyrase B-, and HSP90-like ATPase
MSEPLEPGSIDARPDAGIFNVIRHLNYKAQYAFAEYIDNSISSFEENKDELLKLDPRYKLRIDIEVGPEEIRIKDNAGGIPREQYARAFKTAERPPDPKKGLNEFGMGMKTASIWLSSHWTVISNALDENETGTVIFDVQQMIDTKTTIIKPSWKTKPNAKHHGTTIILKELNRRIASLPSIKEHLGEIYRGYLRSKLVDIRIYRTGDSENDPESIVTFEEMNPLVAKTAYPNGPKGEVTWKKTLKFTMPGGQTVSGTAMVLEKGSTGKAGLYLFRRKRLIIGASDSYRPFEIFGRSTTFPYQRIYGELHLDGFEVTHTKDDIIWGSNGDDEETFIKEVKKALQEGGLDLLMQAMNHRAKNIEEKDKLRLKVEKENEEIENEIIKKKEGLTDFTDDLLPSEDETKAEKDNPQELAPTFEVEKIGAREFSFPIEGTHWHFLISVEKNSADTALFKTSAKHETDREGNSKVNCKITINANNRFALNYLNRNEEFYEVILRFAVSSSFAKARCDQAGLEYTNAFLRYMNESLTLLDGSNKNS